MRTKILFGPPGCGKTFAAEQRAKEIGAEYVEYQCHEWTDAEELFSGVNVQAAVAGDAAHTWQPGVLAVAAQKSNEGGRVVLLIDELDKASERSEYLLLGFLQSGRVPVRPGEHIQANLKNLEVFISSNEVRDHSDALLRRCRRVFMSPISDQKIVEILISKFILPQNIVQMVWRAAREISIQEGNASLSVQEGQHLLEELAESGSFADVQEAFAGWAARTREGSHLARKSKRLPAIWSELARL